MKKTLKAFIRLFLFLLLITLHLNSFGANGVPAPDHVVIVVLENHGYSEIIGSTSAPNINALAADPYSALFTHSFAVAHPSQPNYIDFYSGCNQGVTTDNVPSNYPFTTVNLGRQLIDSGRTFITYSESLPNVGYNGATSGTYARKHNPAANWVGSGTNQIPVTTNQPFTAFPSSNFTALPTVCYVIPNMTDDMHNGTDPSRIVLGDSWVHNNLNNYIQWAKTHNSLLILTFDENDNSAGNQITTIFNGAMVQAGQYSDTINHYSVLRTIEDMFNLPYACNAATASTITNCWLIPAGITSSELMNETKFSVYPNPFSDGSVIKYQLAKKQMVFLEVFDLAGRRVQCFNPYPLEQDPGEYKYNFTPGDAGIYFVKLSTNDLVLTKKIVSVR